MGDEVDELNLPSHSESGLEGVHISEFSELSQIDEQIEQNQAGLLNDVLNNYYTEHDSYVQLQRDLSGLGYTDERVDEISRGAQQERTFRIHHSGPDGLPMPSGLTINQLNFISQAGVHTSDARALISTDDRGRQYILDTRTRDLDGNFARLYLPDPIQFDVLTQTQRQDQTFRQNIIDSIYLREDDDTGEVNTFTRQQRHSINDLTTNYLLGNQTEDDTRTFRQGIQSIEGLSSVDNIDLILFDYFEDVEYEVQYRNNNNGRPQGISQSQWDFMTTYHNSINYNGEPILFSQNTGDRPYFITDAGRIAIPTDAEIRTYSDSLYDNTLENPEVMPRQLTSNELENQTTLINEFFVSPDIPDTSLLAHLQDNAHFDATDPYDAQLGNILQREVASAVTERNFRQLNNGRPSQLTELQYEFLINHTLEDGERRYTGEIIDRIAGTDTRDPYLAYMPSGLREMTMIPTDESIEELISTNRYTSNLPQYQRVEDIPPLPEHPYQIPPPRTEPPTVDRVDIPSLTEPIQIPEGPPVVPGQTQPIDPITQEPIEVPDLDEQVARYERYFNDNQELYQGFRQIYSNILPVFTGIAGGFFAFSIARIRQRNTIQSIVSENEILLEQIETKLEGLNTLLESEKLSLEMDRSNLQMKERVLKGYATSKRVGEQIGEEARERGVQRFQKEVNDILEQVEQAQNQVDSLEMDLSNDETTRTVINEKLDSLINTDYNILRSLTEFAPQVLSGISIGTTLGLVLSGYLYPTYENIEDPYITADNQDYRPVSKKIKKEHEAPPKLVNIDKFMPKDVKIETGPIQSKKIRPMTDTFKPFKNGNRPLKYSEIQEYKSTLNKDELNKLKGKYLIFSTDGKNIQPIKDDCKSVVKKTDILIQRKLTR